MKPLHPTLLQRHHRRALWMRPLWTAIAGLALAVALFRYELPLELHWSLLGGTATLALLFRAIPRRTIRKTANALDAKLALNNRLEAVVELGDRADPLASAARAEVQAFLAVHPSPRPYAWIAGLIIFAVLLPTNLALLLPRTAAVATRPAPIPMTATLPPVKVEELPAPKPAPVAPDASITWVRPEAVITASPKEELPLAAEAKSTTGMQRMKLHVALNGQSRPPLAISGAIETGVKPVSLSLPLESLEAQPEDIVTYYLEAELIRPTDIPAEPVWPPVVSPLQVVEIRPFRAELIAAFDHDDPASAVLQEVQKLKARQLGSLRESFALGRGLTARRDLQGRDLVQAAGTRQSAMGGEIAPMIPSIATAGIPSEAGDQLAAAKTEMEKAAAALVRGVPADALAPQTKAANRLAVAARIVARTIRENRDRLAAQPAASPEPAALEELPARETTLAGQLETLASEQQAIAARLATQTAPPGTFEAQDRIARTVTKLAADPTWPKATAELLNTAGAAAKEAAGQLNEKDELAATEPATRAAQGLAEALANLNARGRERAVEELLAAQQTLNRAATDLRIATPSEQSTEARRAAERTNAVQQDLQTAARREQQLGSAEAAQNLNDLARRIAASDVKRDLAAVAQPPAGATPAENQANTNRASQKLRGLAQQAASAAGSMQQDGNVQEQAIAELRRAQENLERIAGDAARPLHWLNPTSEMSAEAMQKVSLVAETNSEQELSGLTLHLTVNGERRPPLPVAGSASSGVQSVPFTLALETLRVKNDDVISYMMTAERRPLSTNGTPPPPEPISTPVQLITIKSPKKEPNPPGESSPPRDGQGAGAQNPLAPLLAAQRDLVERTFKLEQSAASRADPGWQTSVGAAEIDQRSNGEALQPMLDLASSVAGPDPGAAGPAIEDAKKLLKKARDEMSTAEAALKLKDPAAAAPPAVRAMAALVKLMESDGPSPNAPGPGGPPPPNGPPQPRGNSGARGTPEPLGPSASNEMTDVFETAVEAVQRAIPSEQTAGMPPPPGPGSRLKEIREYAGMLSQRIEGLIEQAVAADNQRKRVQVLTTANPSEAPPAYRPSVEDYFEKLARERRVPTSPAR